MAIDFDTPMTFYELLAVILAAIAMALCQDLVQVKMRNFSPF